MTDDQKKFLLEEFDRCQENLRELTEAIESLSMSPLATSYLLNGVITEAANRQRYLDKLEAYGVHGEQAATAEICRLNSGDIDGGTEEE